MAARRQTRIVASIVAAADAAALAASGADAFRCELREGVDLAAVVAAIRAAEQATARPFGVIADLGAGEEARRAAGLGAGERSRLDAALACGVDWIALPALEQIEDLVEVRRLVGGRAGILLRAGERGASSGLGTLLDLADAVLVVRGELARIVAGEEIPLVQKRLLREARLAAKPGIVAAEVGSPAEAADTAAAIFDGADAILLAAGEAAPAAVATVDRAARRIEADPLYRGAVETEPPSAEVTPPDAVIAAALHTARVIGAAFIATYSTAGTACRRAARHRPGIPVLGVTGNLHTARRVGVCYAVCPVHAPGLRSTEDIARRASEVAVAAGIAENGDHLVVTAGLPIGASNTTNVMRVAWVDDGRLE